MFVNVNPCEGVVSRRLVFRRCSGALNSCVTPRQRCTPRLCTIMKRQTSRLSLGTLPQCYKSHWQCSTSSPMTHGHSGCTNNNTYSNIISLPPLFIIILDSYLRMLTVSRIQLFLIKIRNEKRGRLSMIKEGENTRHNFAPRRKIHIYYEGFSKSKLNNFSDHHQTVSKPLYYIVIWNGPVKFGARIYHRHHCNFRHCYRRQIPMVAGWRLNPVYIGIVLKTYTTVYYCNMNVREWAAEIRPVAHNKRCPNLHMVI